MVPPPVRHPWSLGTEDVRSRLPQGPRGGAHERLLPRRRDDDADDGDARRKPRGRRSFRSAILGCDVPEGSTQAPVRRSRGQHGGSGGGGGRRRDSAPPGADASDGAALVPVSGPTIEVVAPTVVNAAPVAPTKEPVCPSLDVCPVTAFLGYDAVRFQEQEAV
ncbi:hypothetical protein ACQ4PT_033555 [Festuca glaucescens]